MGAILVGGVWAILWAGLFNSLNMFKWGIVVIVVVGPVVEEIMKVAVIACVVEVKPYLFKYRMQIVIAGLAGGLLFGLIENVIYIYVQFPALREQGIDIPPSVELYRWIGCTLLHVT